MTRQGLAALLVWALASPTIPAAAAGDAAPQQRLNAVFLSMDAANAQVTYRSEASGTITTSLVSSPETVEKLAKLRGGQKVILKFRAALDGEVVVEDVKKKRNWWKWGIILGVITLGMVSLATSDSDNIGL